MRVHRYAIGGPFLLERVGARSPSVVQFRLVGGSHTGLCASCRFVIQSLCNVGSLADIREVVC